MKLRSHDVENEWGTMRVWTSGVGPPILCIHGLGGSGRYWQGLAEHVHERHTIIAPDLGGFGGSAKPADGYDREFHLASLDLVTESYLSRGDIAVVAHSIGGVLGALWAARHREAVTSLAVAAPPFPSPRHGGPFEKNPPAAARVLGAAFRTTWPFLSVPVALAKGYPQPVVRDYGRQTLKSRLGTLWSLLYENDARSALEAAARKLDVPVRLMHAADDRTVPVSDHDRWLSLFPHADSRIEPTGGHQFLLRSGFASLGDWPPRAR